METLFHSFTTVEVYGDNNQQTAPLFDNASTHKAYVQELKAFGTLLIRRRPQ